MIDLRSDTVTQPDEAMRQAMAAAPVGDDVFGDDPTVNELERETARLLGKEAAVYMPSGTMTNQVAIRTHTEPGDEVLLDADAHVYYYEAGAPFALSGVAVRFVPARRGIFTADALRAAVRPRNLHHPWPKLVCLENTHNRGGGAVWPREQIEAVARAAREMGLRLHLDGARLWNASVASGVPEAEYCRHFDSVSVCFSKGLGAPVGSALAGGAEFIHRARRFRKMFGGGMRQAGIIAAGALHALRHSRDRLAEDHANARRFAEGIHTIAGIDLRPEEVETNIVYFRVTDRPATKLAGPLREADVWVLPLGPDVLRAVTSLAVGSEQIGPAVEAVRQAMAQGG